MNDINFELIAAGHFLSDSDEITIQDQLDLMHNEEGYDMPEGTNPWIHFENVPLQDMLEYINNLADEFENMYQTGLISTVNPDEIKIN